MENQIVFQKAHCVHCNAITPHLDNRTTGMNCQVCMYPTEYGKEMEPFTDDELQRFWLIRGEDPNRRTIKMWNGTIINCGLDVGRYDFSAGNPVAHATTAGNEVAPITVTMNGIPIPSTPWTRMMALANELKSEEFKRLASQAANEIDDRIKAMGNAFTVPHPSFAPGNRPKPENFSEFIEYNKALTEWLRDNPEIDVNRIKKQVLNCGMQESDILWQLIGWHYEALQKGTREQKAAATEFFISLDYTTGDNKIPNPNQ